MKKNEWMFQESIISQFKVIPFVILLILSSFSTHAQISELEPMYRNFDVEQGLPSSETYFVHQDREGYMWFCTDRGVVRYDGFRMIVFDQSDGLLDNVVFSIYEDRKGRLWFITMNGKLSYYYRGKIYPYKYNELLLKSANLTYPVKSLTIDKDDNLYYSVQGINSMKVTPNGKLTIFKRDSISKLEKFVDKWFYIYGNIGDGTKSFNYKNPKRPSEIEQFHSSEIITVISAVEINSKMIIRANPIIYEAFNKKNQCNYLNVTGLFTTKDKVWICSTTGAYMFDVDSNFDLSKPDRVFLKDLQVSSVTIDKEGGYWFSTLDNGVYYAPNVAIQNLKPSKVRSENNIYDINSVQGELFYSNILGFHHFRTGEQANPPVQFSSQNKMFEWNGKLFVGPGTYKMKDRFSKYFLIKKGAYAGAVKDKHGGFYHSYSDLYYHNRSGKIQKVYAAPINTYRLNQHGIIHALAFDEKGNLYGGSINGLYLYVNGAYKQVQLPVDLMDVRITDLKFHPKWGLVVATRGKGIYILKNKKVVKRITAQNGLVSDLLNSLYFDEDDKLYATSNTGLSKIERFSNSFFRIQNLSKLNGLESSEVNGVYKFEGKLYVATKLGIGIIDGNYNWPIEYPKKQLQIQTIFVNGKELSTSKRSFEFDHTKKAIRFLLKTTNFKSQTKQPYRYRFSKDDPWITGVSGEILLLNPSFEHFFLEVSYKNEYNLWSKPYVLSDFIIYPPFYATNWFFAVILVLIIASGFLFFRRRLVVIQRKNELLRKVDNLEQKALLAQMNPHFIFNSLNSIQSFLLFNENALAERYLIKLSQLIRMTLTNSRESEITVQQEIDVLTKYLELEKMRFKDRFEFEIEIALSKEELNLFVPPMLIQPFIENSIIHGFKQLNQGGLIHLNFKKIDTGKLVVEVLDNGLGYLKNKKSDKDQNHKSYGTQITSERLSLFKEKYDSEFDFSIQMIQDLDGEVKGTKVTICIPIFSKA